MASLLHTHTHINTNTGKQLLVLRGVLSPLLQPEELSLVFGQVCSVYSRVLADAYEALQLQGTHAQEQCRCVVWWVGGC